MEQNSSSSSLVQCSNCKRQFTVKKIALHEVYCERNLRKCEHCEEYIDKSVMNEHIEEMHSTRRCEYCGESVLSSELS